MAAVKKLEFLSLICMFAIGFSCKQKSSAQKIEAPDGSTSERDRNSILDENNNHQTLHTISKDKLKNNKSVQVRNNLCTVEYRYIDPCQSSGCPARFKPVQNVLEGTCADKKQRHCIQVKSVKLDTCPVH